MWNQGVYVLFFCWYVGSSSGLGGFLMCVSRNRVFYSGFFIIGLHLNGRS